MNNDKHGHSTAGALGYVTSESFSDELLQANVARAQSEPGFFQYVVEQVSDDADDESVKQGITLFVPYDVDKPCPCASGEPFGLCCITQGPRRPFVQNPDGDLGLFVMYTETWAWDDFENTRKLLGSRPELFKGETADAVCFYNYRADGRGPGAELFGTIEVTRTHMKIEVLSEGRYVALRRFLEEVLDEALPAGKKEVRLYSPGADAEVDAEVHAEADEDAHVAGPDVDEAPPLLERYRTYRERARHMLVPAVDQILSTELEEAAKMLGWLHGGVISIDEDEVDLLMDFSLHEIRRHGKPVMATYVRRTPPETELDEEIYAGYMNTKVSFFVVDRITAEAVIVRDLLSEDETEMKLVDFGLITTAQPGYGLFTRLVPIEQFFMTSGWVYIVTEEKVEPLLEEYRKILSRTSYRRHTAAGIRLFRKVGETVIVRAAR